MRQNFLVWLFDNRSFGATEIQHHIKALQGENDMARKAADKIARRWIEVYYVDDKDKLASAVDGDNIYVLGHTNVGLTSLWPKSSGSDNEKLDAKNIVERLVWIGLEDKPVKLKLYSCNSAVSDWTGGSNLAKSVKAQLEGPEYKYKKVEVYGYTSTVTDYQEATGWNPVPHKWTSGTMLASRASAYRVKV